MGWRWLAMLTVVVLLLAGCAGGDDDDPEPTATGAPAAAQASPTATAAPSPAAEASPTDTTPPAASTTATTPAATPTTAAAEPTATSDSPPVMELGCGAEISASVTLANDLSCDPVALVVTGDGVVLDLGGRTISGAGPGRRSWPLPSFDVAGVIVHGENVTVRNGTITTTGIGLLIEGASSARVEGLSTNHNYYGIYAYEGGGHTFDGNSVRENVYGLHYQQSHGNTATNNDLSAQTHHSPGGYGLYLYASNDNRFEGNTVQENLNWGLWFSDSTGNLIVRNNIIGNDPQVSDDTGGNTYFDEATLEGNYWADYQGSDADGDGIGDVPYAIGGPGRSADPYPFVAQDGWQGRAIQTTTRQEPPLVHERDPLFYVVTEAGLAAVNAETGELRGAWDVQFMGPAPAVSPDGTRLYGISGDPSASSGQAPSASSGQVAGEAGNVIAIDTASGEVVERWEVPGALVVAAGYDGERVLVSTPEGLTEIMLDTGELRRLPDGANGVAITPSWKHNLALVTDMHWYVHVVYLPGDYAAYKFSLSGKPVQVVDNRAGTRLFALIERNDYVTIIDTEQFLETDQVPLHGISAPTARIAPSPDGTLLYVLDTASSRLAAIDLGTKQIVSDITVSGRAVDLAVSADGAYVVVAADERLVLFDRDLQPTGSVEVGAAARWVVAAR